MKNDVLKEGEISLPVIGVKKKKEKSQLLKCIKRDKWLYIFILPVMLYFIVFKYVPMLGAVMAFQNFKLSTGFLHSTWVGLQNFKLLFQTADFYLILKNTILLNVYNLVFGFPMPIILAIMLNEINNRVFKKVTQSILYLPHFMSWVVLGGILINMLSPSTGVVNIILKNAFGVQPIYFMANNSWWQFMYVVSGIWEGAGWGTIIYLAAITSIDTELYEAARIDGAGKFKQIWHITLPGIKSTIAIMLILRMGSMMNVGFDQVYVLQNSAVRSVADVISTYVYRVGIEGARYSYTTAIGLFQSVVSFVLVFSANRITKMLGEDGLW